MTTLTAEKKVHKKETQFEKTISSRRPKSSDESGLIFSDWVKLEKESNEFLENVKKRKPIVDFKINYSVDQENLDVV